ncbi:MAG: hypothetical protein ABIA76_03665 [Candidatus Diapherotrites archaeon]
MHAKCRKCAQGPKKNSKIFCPQEYQKREKEGEGCEHYLCDKAEGLFLGILNRKKHEMKKIKIILSNGKPPIETNAITAPHEKKWAIVKIQTPEGKMLHFATYSEKKKTWFLNRITPLNWSKEAKEYFQKNFPEF